MPSDVALPAIGALGQDLLLTTRAQRWRTLFRPLLLIGVYTIVYAAGGWWLTPLVVFLIFIAIVTSAHDVVHGSLGLGRRATDCWLFVLGALLLASGHSYRLTHLQHHRMFPAPDDPEGEPARMTLWRAVLHGPIFLILLWRWAYCRAPRERGWLLAEAGWALLAISASVLLWPTTRAVAFYVAQVAVGVWVFPLLTVHLPHRGYGETPLSQTHTLRGRFIPALFLELTYHLEHHLYPQVPSHNLARLSQRLEPTFREAGVVPRRVP